MVDAVLQGSNPQLIVSLADSAMLPKVRQAIRMIQGVSSVRKSSPRRDTITPELAAKIKKARAEFEKGETISFATPDAMQHYFDSL
ncbi:MAG: hypothetical protein MJZ92_03635 [Paludibacteraceae bacterium]|nr:hypothetical protein [Paludibacteraceae bacterium]